MKKSKFTDSQIASLDAVRNPLVLTRGGCQRTDRIERVCINAEIIDILHADLLYS